MDPSHLKLSAVGLAAAAKAFNEARVSKKFNEGEKRKMLLEFYAESAKVKLPAIV